MSESLSITDAQAILSELVARLAPGEEIILTDNHHPVAKLVGQRKSETASRPGPGLCRGMLTIVSDDDGHLDDFEEYTS